MRCCDDRQPCYVKSPKSIFFPRSFFCPCPLTLLTSTPGLYKEAFCGQVTLAWNPENTPGLAGYRVHYGTVSKNYSFAVDAGNQTTTTITGLAAGATYYFAATAYNTRAPKPLSRTKATYTVPSSCSYAITPASASLTATGGTGKRHCGHPGGYLQLDHLNWFILDIDHIGREWKRERHGDLFRGRQHRHGHAHGRPHHRRTNLHGQSGGRTDLHTERFNERHGYRYG